MFIKLREMLHKLKPLLGEFLSSITTGYIKDANFLW